MSMKLFLASLFREVRTHTWICTQATSLTVEFTGVVCVLLYLVQDKQRRPYSADVSYQDSSLVILTSTSLAFMAALLYLWYGALLMLVPQSAGWSSDTQWLQLLLFVPKIQPEAGFHHWSCLFFQLFYSNMVLPNQWVFGDLSPAPPVSQLYASQLWCAVLL